MSENGKHASQATKLHMIDAMRLGRDRSPLPQGSKHGRVVRAAHGIAEGLANRREAREVRRTLRAFEELSANARGLNRDVLRTMTAVAGAGLPGHTATELLTTRTSWRDAVGAQVTSRTWSLTFGRPRHYENEDGSRSPRVIESDIALGANAPEFSVDSPEAPRLGKAVPVSNLMISYEAPLPQELRDTRPLPGRTTVWINRLDNEQRQNASGAEGGHPLGAGYRVDIGPDGNILYLGADTHGGGYEEIKSSTNAEQRLQWLLHGVVGAANAVATPQVPDSPQALLSQG